MTQEAHIRDALIYLKAIEKQKSKAFSSVQSAREALSGLEAKRENASSALYEANMECSTSLEDFLSNLNDYEVQEEKYALALEELLRLKDLS